MGKCIGPCFNPKRYREYRKAPGHILEYCKDCIVLQGVTLEEAKTYGTQTSEKKQRKEAVQTVQAKQTVYTDLMASSDYESEPEGDEVPEHAPLMLEKNSPCAQLNMTFMKMDPSGFRLNPHIIQRNPAGAYKKFISQQQLANKSRRQAWEGKVPGLDCCYLNVPLQAIADKMGEEFVIDYAKYMKIAKHFSTHTEVNVGPTIGMMFVSQDTEWHYHLQGVRHASNHANVLRLWHAMQCDVHAMCMQCVAFISRNLCVYRLRRGRLSSTSFLARSSSTFAPQA